MVTQVPGGTAFATFKDAPYTVAGKTGSAQVAGLRQDENLRAEGSIACPSICAITRCSSRSRRWTIRKSRSR
jgi:hypothetical protein